MENELTRHARKFLFTSGKGGVGKSTLAATFARLLADQNTKVLVIDFDMALRTQDIMLGLSSQVVYDWGDVMDGRCRPLTAIVSDSFNGPELLAAPLKQRVVTREQARDLVNQYVSYYDYIIMDSPAGVGAGFLASAWAADYAFVIATPDPVAVHSAEVASGLLEEEGIETRLIINRFRKRMVENGMALNIDEVIDTVGARLIGVVPEDLQLAVASQKGRNVDLRRKSAKAMGRILRRMKGEHVPLKI